jgi:hypothetical protein
MSGDVLTSKKPILKYCEMAAEMIYEDMIASRCRHERTHGSKLGRVVDVLFAEGVPQARSECIHFLYQRYRNRNVLCVSLEFQNKCGVRTP